MRATTRDAHQERILRTVVHIQSHLDGDLELATLARVACLAPYHFHRVFRSLVGETTAQYVRRLRLERPPTT